MFDLDIDLDNYSSIQDVLMCWDSGEKTLDDGDDADFIIPNLKDLDDDPSLSMVLRQASPECDLSCARGRQRILEELKRKYPSFIPPPLPELPIGRRSRPLCTFVNFLGTRKGCPKTGTAISSKRKRIERYEPAKMASPFFMEIPISAPPRPAKRTKCLVSPMKVPVVSPTISPSTRRPIVKLSTLPALLPTMRISGTICEYQFQRFSCEMSHSFPDRQGVGCRYHF